MMRSLMRWTFIGVSGLMVVLLTAPTDVCGCGAVIPLDGDAEIAKEIALIRWDDGVEDIVMQLNVEGNSKEAAWILPVPAPATVKLGHPELFETLDELTKPIVQQVYQFLPRGFSFGAGAAPPGAEPRVTLISRQTLGPFDVSTLDANDADALSEWLESNGYTFPARLTGVLRPYVEQDGFYVAIRLAPAQSGNALTGALDPLWLTFESDRIIYPMRPAALMAGDLPMQLYVLAEHRVDHPDPNQYPFDPSTFAADVTFADWVNHQSLEESSPLAPFATRRMFLTKFEDHIFRPGNIIADFVFTFAENDETYRTVEYEFVDNFIGVPNVIWVCCILPLGLLMLARALRKRAKQAPKGLDPSQG